MSLLKLTTSFYPLFYDILFLIQARSNVKGTITCMKLLLGRKFKDPSAQAEMAKAPFECVELDNGGIGIKVWYNDEETTLPAEHYMAMMLTKANDIVKAANKDVAIGDMVLAVPPYFNNSQRAAILRACEIASLNCLKVVNESTSIALSYGIFKSAKKLFDEKEPTTVMFIDLGYTCFTVCCCEFVQGKMKMLGSVCDTFGGRDYDDALIEYCAEEFKTKTKVDVSNNKKALLKIQAAVEKAKKILSPHGVLEAPVNIECLAEDRDLNCKITKDLFNEKTQHLNDRLAPGVTKCLEEAGLTKEQLNEVEIVGGSTRIEKVKEILGAALGLDPAAMNHGLKTTMNADEPVARGNALQCAMLSSRVRVQPFEMIDRQYYGILATYDATSTGDDGKEEEVKSSSAQLYTRGDELPRKPRRLTFRKKTQDFTVTLSYDDSYPEDHDKHIATYTIKVPEGVPPQDVRVNFNIDKNGCVYLVGAEMLEELPPEEKKEEVSAKEEDKAADAKEGVASTETPAEGAATPEAAAGDAKDDTAGGGDDKKAEESKATDGASEAKDAVKAPPKKKFKKTDLQTVVNVFGLNSEDIKKSLELEAAMAFEDKLIIDTINQKNELESYIYDMRDKIDMSLKEFCTEEERSAMSSALLSGEDWLYGDGYEATKRQYAERLADLQKLGNPIVNRFDEEEQRPVHIENFNKQVSLIKSFLKDYSDKYSHIEDEERDSLRSETTRVEEWMMDMITQQGQLPKSSDPVLTGALIQEKRKALLSVSNPIMTKKKPVLPAPTPAPAPENNEEKSEAKDGDAAASDDKGTDGDSKADEKGASDAPKDDDKMDTEATEGATEQ